MGEVDERVIFHHLACGGGVCALFIGLDRTSEHVVLTDENLDAMNKATCSLWSQDKTCCGARRSRTIPAKTIVGGIRS